MKRTKEQAAQAIIDLLNAEPETDEEVNAFLRVEGCDPQKIGADGARFVRYSLDAMKRIAELEAENAALRKVAEAAREFLRKLVLHHYSQEQLDLFFGRGDLANALAELDALKGGKE